MTLGTYSFDRDNYPIGSHAPHAARFMRVLTASALQPGQRIHIRTEGSGTYLLRLAYDTNQHDPNDQEYAILDPFLREAPYNTVCWAILRPGSKLWLEAADFSGLEARVLASTADNSHCKFAGGGARCVHHCGDPICLGDAP